MLTLRSDISLDQKYDRISVNQISDIIGQFIKKKQQQQMSDASVSDQKKEIEEIIKLIPSLQFGLDVNCGFTRLLFTS